MNAIFYAKLTNLLLDKASNLTGRNKSGNNQMVRTEAEVYLWSLVCTVLQKNTERYISLTGRDILGMINAHFSNTNCLQFWLPYHRRVNEITMTTSSSRRRQTTATLCS